MKKFGFTDRARILPVIAIICLTISTCVAQETLDTTLRRAIPPDYERFCWKDVVAPAALITVGCFGVHNGWFNRINQEIRDDMGRLRGDCFLSVDDWLQYLPAAGYLTIGFIPGANGRHDFAERICAGFTAYASVALLTNLVKAIAQEKRPDSDARNSFHSGHSATVFAGAELVRMEYGHWAGLGAYAIATGVGILRMYNDRHWLNDVLAGAGVGILCAHIGYWLLPLERRWFRLNPRNELVILPNAQSNGSYGLSLSARF